MSQDTTHATPQTSPQMERFSYDDAIVRKFLVAMYAWGIVAFLVGIVAAVELFLPWARDLAFNKGFVETSKLIDWFLSIPYLQFGRIRPLHTNAAIFAFAGNAIFAAVYYSTQRLCKTRMASDLLSTLHFWGWQLIIVSAALTLPLGITQGKEYAELEWPIDIMIAVVWLVFFGGNFFWTLLKRRERHMYVALWFYIATILTVTVLHVFNNICIPLFGAHLKSYSVYAGAQDAIMQWWYGHNAVAFFLTTPFLGLMYYYLPKAANRPVFSYRLSILHFWSLVFIYIWAGPHHLHYLAIPDWASSLGMAFSIMLWMPSWGGMLNGLLTLRGAWNKVATDPVLKFFVVGVTFYGMATFEGPTMAVKAVNSLSHYTDWTIAHVHGGALGWNGMMSFGMMYWLLPRLFQTKKLYSVKLATAHFWMATIGILLYIIPIYFAGITQGLMWRTLNESGGLAYGSFVHTVIELMPYYVLRALGGCLFLAGALLGGINFYKTWKMRPAQYEEPVHEAPALTKQYDGDLPTPQPRVEGTTELGRKLDIFNQMWWHRKWERLPITFSVLTLIAVLIASAFELVPTFVIRSNIPQIAGVRPYTPLELYGRDIYIAEGCYNCHSQMIRPLIAETQRYGEYSKPGEFIYDHPFQWGSRRIGPDLAREGGKQTNQWHILHLTHPTATTPDSIMPVYRHLLTEDIDWKSFAQRMKAINVLHPSVPDWNNPGKTRSAYTQQELDNAIADNKALAAAIHTKYMDQNRTQDKKPSELFADPMPRNHIPLLQDKQLDELSTWILSQKDVDALKQGIHAQLQQILNSARIDALKQVSQQDEVAFIETGVRNALNEAAITAESYLITSHELPKVIESLEQELNALDPSDTLGRNTLENKIAKGQKQLEGLPKTTRQALASIAVAPPLRVRADSKMIALVAYMQRIGTDLTRKVETPAETIATENSQ